MSDKEFWDKDMTTVHDKHSWFGALSIERRIIYCLLLLFVISWSFLLGFTAIASQQPSYDEIIKFSAADLEEVEEEEQQAVELSGSRVILVVGCDNRGSHDVGLTDTMMLVFMDMDDKTVDVLSLPRDTYVQIPGYGKDKINAAYSNGGGIERARDTVEHLTGISIDNYVIVDFQGFVECIDAIGGVELEVDERMYKPSENIDLQPGPTTLTGEQALGFVRYRGYINGDLGRIEHQQYFIERLADQMLTLDNLAKVPELIGIALKHISTDMKLSDVVDIATYMIQMDMTDLRMHTVPCEAMWMPYGGLWISFVFVQEAQFINLLTEITNGEIQFSPNIVGHDGQARYSIPSSEPEPTENAPETIPEVGEPVPT
ncbi:MAG: LCP family protein, partial [Bacillota bacterium]|nr:LCP family protein [Bacillota bacterium]